MIFRTYASLAKSNIGKDFKAFFFNSSNSFLFSPIETFFSQVNPWVIEFKLDLLLPRTVLGPVDFLAFSLLANVFLLECMHLFSLNYYF